MVALSAPDVLLWQSSYSVYYDAYVHAPTTVFAARVNMPTVTYPTNIVTYDSVTVGSYTDLEPELLLLVGSAAGLSDYGRQRIHANASGVVATSTTINIGRSSQGVNDGSLNLVDNAYLTVLDLRLIWAAPPFIDDLTNPDAPITYKDGIIPFNITYAQSPICNMGVDSLKMVATSSDTALFDFDASASYATQLGAGGALTYAWVFPGGTPSTATSATVTGVSFPVGSRYVKCTVTDSLGNTQAGWRLKAVSYPGDPNLISKFTSTRRRLPTDGQEFQIGVDSSLPFGTYPDGTEILIAERERYGTTVGSLTGYPDAENMVIAGWMHAEDNSGEANKKGFIGRTTLTILDAAGRLKLLPGFPQVVVREFSAEIWEEMQAANLDRYEYYLGKWHSNAFTRVDFTWSGTLETYAFSTLGSDGQSLYEQMDKRCQAIAYRLTCNKNGQLAMKPDPLLQPTAAQAAQYSLPTARTTTVVVPITEHDWMNYRYTYTRHPRIHWNWGNAILVTTDNADTLKDIPTAFCVAPGLAPGQGVGQQTSGEQLAVNASELYVREGNRYAARMNAVTGFFTVQVRPGDVIDPAEMVWVQFSITSATAGPRGRTYLSERFLPIEVNYTYTPQKGLTVCKLTLEREVSGTPAVLDPQPQPGQSQLPPGLPPFSPPPSVIPGTGGVLGRGTATIAFVDNLSELYEADNSFQNTAAQGGPVWDREALSGLGLAGVPIMWIQDAYAVANAVIITTTKAWQVLDIFGTPSLANPYTFRDTGTNRSMQSERGTPGFFAVVSYQPALSGSHGTDLDVTQDSGVTYTRYANVFGTWVGGSGDGYYPGCYVSAHVAGKFLTSGFTGAGVTSGAIYICTAYGATRTRLNAFTFYGLAGDITIAYQDESETTVYHGGTVAGALRLYRSTSTSQTDISPTYLGTKYGPYGAFGVKCCDQDQQSILVCGESAAGAGDYGVFLSRNRGDTWAVLRAPGSSPAFHSGTFGSDPNTLFIWATGALWMSIDGGQTWADKSGNLGSFTSPAIGDILNLMGK